MKRWVIKFLEWLTGQASKKVKVLPDIVTPPADKPTTPSTVDTTGELVDPPGYSEPLKNPDWEEVGIEQSRKIICRLCVIRGKSGGFWMLSSLDGGRIRKTANGLELQDWTADGYTYHVRGSVASKPQQSAIRTLKPEVAGNTDLQKYIILEVRKDQ